jgi:hypothetical protein
MDRRRIILTDAANQQPAVDQAGCSQQSNGDQIDYNLNADAASTNG